MALPPAILLICRGITSTAAIISVKTEAGAETSQPRSRVNHFGERLTLCPIAIRLFHALRFLKQLSCVSLSHETASIGICIPLVEFVYSFRCRPRAYLC